MMMDTVTTDIERVKQVIAEVCAIDPSTVQDDGFLLGYDIDSLRRIELMISLEEAFDIEVPEHDPDLRDVRTVRDLAAWVDRLREADGR
jgi:acyl carrier protein